LRNEKFRDRDENDGMRSSAGRLLSLLTLLQARSDLTSGELADRLQVTTRTIRNDVQQLCDLGYPIHGTPGVAGGTASGLELGYLRCSSTTRRPWPL